ncbi:MAG: hypothetical protein R6X17_10240 [Candidatus Competibacteraceae bacterium]
MEAILASLADARHLFEHGTMEERKRIIRAFVENLTVDGESSRGELRAKRIPDPCSQGIGDSFKVVAGALYEVQQRGRAPEIEVIPLRFEAQGRALVLAGVGSGAG